MVSLTVTKVPPDRSNTTHLQAVRGDADEIFPFFPLPIGEIVGHPAQHIGPFVIEVSLGLEHGPADQGVEPAFDFRDAAFEIKRVQRDAEFLDQQLAKIRLDLVMTGSSGEVAQQVGGT